MTVITHISQQDFDNLCKVFAYFTPTGLEIPEWLAEWGLHKGFLKEIYELSSS